MGLKDFSEKDRLIARDISWLKFNDRVLEEARDANNPLLERAKFLAIFVNNLDEFFMVRVAGLKNLIRSDFSQKDQFGYYSQELLEEIKEDSDLLTSKLYQTYKKSILKDLEKEQIYIKTYKDLKPEQKKFVKNYFETMLFPIITPLAVDPGHPFPILPSKSLAFVISLSRKGEHHLAVLPIPTNVPRLCMLPSAKNEYSFILIDEIIRQHLNVFFSGYKVDSHFLFRLIRDSEFSVEEDITPDLLQTIEEEIRKRARASVVYLEIEKNSDAPLLLELCERLDFDEQEIIEIDNHMDLSFLFELSSKIQRADLLYEPNVPGKLEYENIFEKISEEDFVIHMPYQSFDPTLDLIESAAYDKGVLAIKMTLYRTDKDSAIIRALKEAVQNHKQVTILVEIKARFDEANNIKWARELEEVGCHVIYGMPGLKVHSKMVLIVREEEGHIKRYVHLSTGNYNEKTAKIYTDVGYFTSNEDFAKDVSDVFNVVTGFSVPSTGKRVITAPNDLREYFFSLINREIQYHKANKNGMICVKINSLEDVRIIDKLYEASAAGVQIQLVVRGICCLVPGVKGLSENIQVKSIVGRFLEHSRIFIFNNNDKPRVFLSSADWMRRNFDRRIELMFEIYNEEIKKELQGIFNAAWNDNMKARILEPQRVYVRPTDNKKSSNFQEYLLKYYKNS